MKTEIKETYFEIVDGNENNYQFDIIQRYRTVYYEDCLNPSGYRDSLTCSCKTKEIAIKLCKIFNDNKFTSEWLNKNRYVKPYKLTNSSKGRIEHEIYTFSDSKVKYEEDLYNGTDQSLQLYQLMKDENGKYTNRSKMEIICKFWKTDYVYNVINKYSRETKNFIL